MPAKRAEWAMLAALMMLVLQAGLLAAVLTSQSRAKADFRALFTAGVIVRSGNAHRLYDYAYEAEVQNAVCGKREAALPFLYPPFAALLFASFAGLPYLRAFTLFAGINLALSAICAWLLVRIGGLPGQDRLLACACCVGFTPLGFAVLQGQVSVLLLLAFCLCQLALEREHPFAAGLCLAMALVKFQLALPVALLFLLWRQWRFSLGFAAGAAVLSGLSIAAAGTAGTLDYGASLAGITRHLSGGAAQAHYGIFPSKMPNLHGLASLLLGTGDDALAVTAVLSIAILAWVASRRPSLPLAVLAALLVSYHLQPHDLTLLLLPLAVSAGWLLEPPASALPHRVTLQTVSTVLLLLPPVYLVLEGAALIPLLAAPVLLLLLSLNQRHAPDPGLLAEPLTA